MLTCVPQSVMLRMEGGDQRHDKHALWLFRHIYAHRCLFFPELSMAICTIHISIRSDIVELAYVMEVASRISSQADVFRHRDARGVSNLCKYVGKCATAINAE